jgi:xanthine dehydrogenase accessory factor
MSLLLQERAAGPPAELGSDWLKPLRDWPRALQRALEHEPVIVRIVLVEVRGSAPREAGAGMLVGREILEGTIGGGALEWQALGVARSMLAEPTPPVRVQRLVLGSALAQCCGGAVQVWIERHTRAQLEWLAAADRAARQGPALLSSTLIPGGVERAVLNRVDAARCADQEALQALHGAACATRAQLRCTSAGQVRLLERLDDTLPALWLFGAGHVGQALARILMALPLQLTWIDSRAGIFPALPAPAVSILRAADPVQCVARAPAGARFLVLTHSHPLDYALCRAILERADSAWTGLIGSASKAARFRSRLARDGLSAEAIARLVCPIGIEGITSKWPGAIAVAVAAQVLQDLAGASAVAPGAHGAPLAEEHCAGQHCALCQPHPAVP